MTQLKLSESQICAGGKKIPYRDQNHIDMGGLLMHVSRDTTYTIEGIRSISPNCCDKQDYPKVYTRVADYVNWIMNNLKP